MNNFELNTRRIAKNNQQRLQEALARQRQMNINQAAVQKKNNEDMQLKLTPLSASKSMQPRYTKEDILKLSQTLRLTHQPNLLQALSVKRKEEEKKFQYALKKLKHHLHKKKLQHEQLIQHERHVRQEIEEQQLQHLHLSNFSI